MSWSKIDDLLPHHRKVVAAGLVAPAVFGYYVASICYAQRHFSDGVILRTDFPLLLPSSPHPTARVLGMLESCRLWDRLEDGRDGWRIHDYLEWNDSADIRREKLARDAARKRGLDSVRNPDGLRTDSGRTPNVAPIPIPSSSEKLSKEKLLSEKLPRVAIVPVGEPSHRDGTGSLTRPADGSGGETNRECQKCYKTWLGGPRCPWCHGKKPRAPTAPAPTAPALVGDVFAAILPLGGGP